MMLTVPLIIEKIYRNKIQPVVSKGLMKYLFHFPPTRKAFSYMVGLKLKKTFGKQLHFFGIGGALLDAKVELFLKEAKFPYEIGYGLTETAPLLAGSPGGKRRYRSTGPSVPGQELKIININFKTGEGEIIAKGDNVMKGYYKNEELTKTCFTEDGWFKTGDLGIFDKHMLNSITTGSGNSIAAIAELQYQCGVAVSMHYAPEASGAYSTDVPAAVRNYFGYSLQTQYAERASYNSTQWQSMDYFPTQCQFGYSYLYLIRYRIGK